MADTQVQLPKDTAPKWDDMTAEQQRAEKARLLKLEKEAETPDRSFDTQSDQQMRSMKMIFQKQAWHTVQLFQINGAMKAEGITALPDRECGINGHNFIVPRGRPVKIPEGLIRVLYNAGEIDGYVMINLGLMTVEEVVRDQNLSKVEAEHLAQLGKVQHD